MVKDISVLNESQVKMLAANECLRLGYKFLEIKKLPNPNDNYLRYIIGYSEKKKEYGVWLFNIQMGGLHHGHYFNYWSCSQEEARDKAFKDFQDR